MNMNYTTIIKQQDNRWIGWIEEIPGVNCQELTREELLESLTITFQYEDKSRQFCLPLTPLNDNILVNIEHQAHGLPQVNRTFR